ncbi:TonB-dependent receptor [Flavobacterium sp. XGLA_31]|uniref:TonB-dependent receptor plug domain-containing protein n=1 Tax=Flavobacterium sp. XGLA_31 TaxID=3447666 RepID=UPI003F3AC818
MKRYLLCFLLGPIVAVMAQETPKDTVKPLELKEIIVIGKKTPLAERQSKTLSSIDEYLQKSMKVGMIKRGAYAWEPIINSMATERTLVTIDGMRIFGACTDKMDPITSYVEVSNLSEATVCSGQEGACYGSTIGGSVDLKRNPNAFSNKKWDFNFNSGFESNNRQKIIGASVTYADSLFYFDTDFMSRNADNYKAGNDREILFSQFKKINFSGTSGFKLAKNHLVEASVIYDKATNVGYPALPMDVSLAEALITSLKWDYVPIQSIVNDWETKIYFNTITHRMDDTHRPSVPIHMDMPGWSSTYGYYSKVKAVAANHHWVFNLSAFYNQSKAEMTMYPQDPNENPMFMYTWPDVRTFYQGFYAEDDYAFTCHSGLKVSGAVGLHSNKVASTFGLESLQIFYPDMKAERQRILKSLALNYHYGKDIVTYGLGIAYGERAPSVSEGYGFYLYNSFDNYDQIGNPNLKNEKSVEGNGFVGFQSKKGSVKVTASYFHIVNYIIAQPHADLVPMTIGANGVKVYNAVPYATIWNVGWNAAYKLTPELKWKGQVLYTYGKDSKEVNLPFISPLSYTTDLVYHTNKYSAELSLQGNATQTRYSPYYGEDRTPDYALINAGFGYNFKIGSCSFGLRAGVENLLDTYYTTYSDWNNIPRMGRNFYTDLVVKF